MLTAHKISYAVRKFSILDKVDISVASGELLVIVGPNGAGKSTLLSVLANEALKQEEVVYFKKKPFKDWDLQELAHNKAKFSQQNNPDIPLLVKDIVLMGRYPYFNSNPNTEDWEVIDKTMREMDIYALKERNYNTLSGGEKQRVHLARVFAQLHNPIGNKLIFLDEPLNNLDVKHQYNIMETIRKFTREGNTAILVLHDLNLAAQFADTVLLIKKGKVVASGKPNMVFTEKLITETYNFPCMIYPNPITKNPMVLFGTANNPNIK